MRKVEGLPMIKFECKAYSYGLKSNVLGICEQGQGVTHRDEKRHY